jgi:hypothetical protein
VGTPVQQDRAFPSPYHPPFPCLGGPQLLHQAWGQPGCAAQHAAGSRPP